MRSPREYAEQARSWLAERALPLWTTAGFDEKTGTFVEALSLEGRPLDAPRRAMVQARQIYALRIAAKLGCFPGERARALALRAASELPRRWGLPSGAFLKSVDAAGKPADATPDLYTQAFAIFGLANAHAFEPRPEFKARALEVVEYLRRERRAPAGGYTELDKGAVLLRSNPHMHLYESFLAWLEVDPDPRWKALADEIADLCLARFIDPETGCLAEVFDDAWRPVRGPEGFFFEPGHHFEWAWLMTVHQRLSGRDLAPPPRSLYQKARESGLSADGFAYDEVWCGGAAKKRSSRFWPQGERAKAAVRLGLASDADQAVSALLTYLGTPTPGLWSDQRLEDGGYTHEPARASALYHIIAAFDEYLSVHPALKAAA